MCSAVLLCLANVLWLQAVQALEGIMMQPQLRRAKCLAIQREWLERKALSCFQRREQASSVGQSQCSGEPSSSMTAGGRGRCMEHRFPARGRDLQVKPKFLCPVLLLFGAAHRVSASRPNMGRMPSGRWTWEAERIPRLPRPVLQDISREACPAARSRRVLQRRCYRSSSELWEHGGRGLGSAGASDFHTSTQMLPLASGSTGDGDDAGMPRCRPSLPLCDCCGQGAARTWSCGTLVPGSFQLWRDCYGQAMYTCHRSAPRRGLIPQVGLATGPCDGLRSRRASASGNGLRNEPRSVAPGDPGGHRPLLLVGEHRDLCDSECF